MTITRILAAAFGAAAATSGAVNLPPANPAVAGRPEVDSGAPAGALSIGDPVAVEMYVPQVRLPLTGASDQDWCPAGPTFEPILAESYCPSTTLGGLAQRAFAELGAAEKRLQERSSSTAPGETLAGAPTTRTTQSSSVLTTCGAFKQIVERTTKVTWETLQSVPQLQPGERQADPTSTLELGKLRNPEGRSRAVVCYGVDPEKLTLFARQNNLLFNTARDVKDFSGERILVVPEEITAAAEPLPLGHLMSAEQIARDFGGRGLTLTPDGVRLKGKDYVMQLCPLHPTPNGGTTGYMVQQPHFHVGAPGGDPRDDVRLLAGVVPESSTLLLWHPKGALVAPAGTFVAIEIDPGSGHQFGSLHKLLLQRLVELDPELADCLSKPGDLEPEHQVRLQAFLATHIEIPGLRYKDIKPEVLAESSALLISSHTYDPPATGAEGENQMAAQTYGIENPEKFGTFMPWTPPPG